MKDGGHRIAVAGCKHTTLEFIEALERNGHSVSLLITIGPELAERAEVAGYMDLAQRVGREERMRLYSAETYSLKAEKDQAALETEEIDILFVIGWQRLIPAWLLERLEIGAFGCHGSSKPLPYGRGRSPMNWSLLQNKTSFFSYLFKYSPGVDDGGVVGELVFRIDSWDTCLTLHYKNTLGMIRLALEFLDEVRAGTWSCKAQSEEGATYYPKRSPEDGLIVWSDSSYDVFCLVRSVTRPFAGAFSFLDPSGSNRLRIWRGIPFDGDLTSRQSPGVVEYVFDGGEFLVRCGVGCFLVQDYCIEGSGEVTVGLELSNAGRARPLFDNVPV